MHRQPRPPFRTSATSSIPAPSPIPAPSHRARAAAEPTAHRSWGPGASLGAAALVGSVLVGAVALVGAAMARGGAALGYGAEGDGAAPWTPPRLDVGVDLSGIRLAVGSAAPALPVVPETFGPQPFGSPGADLGGDHGDHDHGVGGFPPANVPSGPAGRLEVLDGAEAHDFGSLVEGAVVDHTFRLRSTGEHPLVISSVRASCGCTVPTTMRIGADGTKAPYVFGDAIAPGEELELIARLNTEGKKAALQSTVTVFSNDPAATHMLRLSAQVQPFFEFSPNAYINFGSLLSSETKTERLTIVSPVAERFGLTLEAGQTMPEYLHVELVPQDPDEQGRATRYELVATIGPNAPEGPNQNWPLRLVSDVSVPGAAARVDGSAKHYSTTAYTVANVRGLVSAAPAYVSFGLVRAGQEVKRSLTIDISDPLFEAGAMPVTLVGKNAADEELLRPRMQTAIQPVAGQPGKFTLEVTLSELPENFDGTFTGSFEVAVGHPTKPVLSIPFSGVVRNIITQPAPPIPVPGTPTTGGAAPGGNGGSGGSSNPR
jgi:hypothetical protein